MKNLKKLLPYLLTFVAGGSVIAWGIPTPRGPDIDLLISTDETVLGQEFKYPQGKAKITGAIVTVPPGVTLRHHHHPVPVFGYVLQGELIVDYGEARERIYKKGDSLVEAFNTPHSGRNGGKGNVKILVVYAGADGIPNTVLGGS